MWVLFLFEVKHYFKNKLELINFTTLFISIILLKVLVEVNPSELNQALPSEILWIALIFATLLGSVSLFQRDQESGRLDYYQLTNVSLAGVIYTKWLVYYASILCPLALLLPISGVLLGIPSEQWPHIAVGLASGALPLTVIAALASALMARLERAGALLSLMVLPMTIPVIIFGNSYLSVDTEQSAASLLFLWGFSLFLLPVLGLAGSSCIRSGN